MIDSSELADDQDDNLDEMPVTTEDEVDEPDSSAEAPDVMRPLDDKGFHDPDAVELDSMEPDWPESFDDEEAGE